MSEVYATHIEKLSELLSEERIEEALDYIETIPADVRSHWEIENMTGVISCYCGMFEEAVGFFKRALQGNPNSAEIYYNLSYAYINMQDFAQAELMLSCCEHNTDDEDTLANIAQIRSDIKAVYDDHPELNEENNVLMLAYYFPPLAGSGVFRSIKFARYLSDYGWKPTVISTDVPPKGWSFNDNSLVAEIPEGMDVFRVPDILNKEDNVEVTSQMVDKVITHLKGILQHDKSAMDVFLKLINNQKYSDLLTFPCHALLWSIDVIRYIEGNVDLSKFKAVYTTSGPSSAHLVGFYLKKKYNIPWVADYRDPWTSNPYASFNMAYPIHKLFYRLENILLKQADCNLTIVDALVEDYQKKFGLPAEQIECITNGYDESDFAELKERSERTEKFTLTYSGLMYTNEHNITPIMNAIKQLCDEGKMDVQDLRFRIIGQGHEDANKQFAAQYGLADAFEQTGYVEHKTALQANLDSDLLLILVGDAPKFRYFYPGKIFEYLRSGKPIMALASEESGVAKILSETGHGKTFLSTQTEDIKSYILAEYENWKSRTDNRYERSPLIKVYERRYLTMKLADALYTAANNPREFDAPVYFWNETDYYNDYYDKLQITEIGVNSTEQRDKKIIVVIPSFPPRLKRLDRTIKSLMNQTVKADEIVVYLSVETKDTDIPERLRDLEKYGLKIKTGYDNIICHKGWYYGMQEYPDDIIIIVDDDCIYDDDVIESLMESYKKYPNAISARRAHKMLLDENKKLLPYNKWQFECKEYDNPSMHYFVTQLGGVLYPPKIFKNKLTFNLELVMEYCPNNGDIWLKFAEFLDGIPVVIAKAHKHIHPMLIADSQYCGLVYDNVGQSKNDMYINNLIRNFNVDIAKIFGK